MARATRLGDYRMTDADGNIRINRAPVLTLWAAVVAERLGFDRDTALTLGQAVAGLSAHAKGVPLGILEPRPEQLRVDLLGLAVPVVRTPDGLQAVNKGKPGNPGPDREVAGRQVQGLAGGCASCNGRAGCRLGARRAAAPRVSALRAVQA